LPGGRNDLAYLRMSQSLSKDALPYLAAGAKNQQGFHRLGRWLVTAHP